MLVFDADSYDLASELTLTFSQLAHNADYRVVAIAYGDDGGSSTDAEGNDEPDVDSLSSGKRRADVNFARAAQDVADDGTDPVSENYYDFSTTSSDALDLSGRPLLSLNLRAKNFSGAASGVAVTVSPGALNDPAPTAATIATSLVQTTFNFAVPNTPAWQDTGRTVTSGQEFRVRATASNEKPNFESTTQYFDAYADTNFPSFSLISANGVARVTDFGFAGSGLGNYGAVIYKIGAGGTPFPVGGMPFRAAPETGTLFLAVNNLAGAHEGTVHTTIATR
jgi:hypothetical protein